MIRIRKIALEDAAGIKSLARHLGYQPSSEDLHRNIPRIMNNPDHAAFVAENDGTIRGWAHVFLALRLGSGSFAEIGGLVVADSHTRQGIGQQLVLACENWAHKKGMIHIRVRCNIKRTGAHQFYKSMIYLKTKNQFVFSKQLAD
ncbi:MAG: GNAT family N-acetyltransferase [Calditrichaeota bacterium]|nr:MAG: GNAT family N-acetyltransferase [Calditrichota bacterium]